MKENQESEANEIRNKILNQIKSDYFPRKMELSLKLFVSFLPTLKFKHMESNMSYTYYESECGTLKLTGGYLNNEIWLSDVKHKTIKQNPYNHFVNAFAYWDLLNDEGKGFFIKFYQPQFGEIIRKHFHEYEYYLEKADHAMAQRNLASCVWQSLINPEFILPNS